jgi:hypothetical protein
LVDDLSNNPYGTLKVKEEKALKLSTEQCGSSLTITRLWNLSGKDIQNTTPFALSNFILDALAYSKINIQSKNLVFPEECKLELFKKEPLFSCRDIPRYGISKKSNSCVNQVPLNPVVPVTNRGRPECLILSNSLQYTVKLYQNSGLRPLDCSY